MYWTDAGIIKYNVNSIKYKMTSNLFNGFDIKFNMTSNIIWWQIAIFPNDIKTILQIFPKLQILFDSAKIKKGVYYEWK